MLPAIFEIMKTSHLLISLLLYSTITFGQNSKFALGIEGGPSMVNLYGNELLKSCYQPTVGFTTGIFAQINLKNHLSLRTNISYERKGSEYNSEVYFEPQTSPEGNIVRLIGHLKFNYLTMPILIQLSIGKKVNYFANVGPYWGYLFSVVSVWEESKSFSGGKETHTNSFKRFDLGISSGLGVSVPIKEHLLIVIELRNNIGLFDVRKPSAYVTLITKTISTNLLVGLSYKLSKGN